MTAATPVRGEGRPRRRAALWALLVALLVVAQSLLVALTVSWEANRSQEEIEGLAAEAAQQVRRQLLRSLQDLQVLAWPGGPPWTDAAAELMRARGELLRVERRDAAMQVAAVVDAPRSLPLFSLMPRAELSIDAEAACLAARRQAMPLFSRTYFVPLPDSRGLEVIDLCVPLQGQDEFLVATFGLLPLLDAVVALPQARRVEASIVEGDGARLARAGHLRGAGVFVAEQVIDLPGAALRLRLDSNAGRPSLIPNLTLALVLGLSLALFGVVLLLARDVRRRARAERALADALAFRKAMEDSLVTGLRAHDLDGRITYVNPAFCAMVGFTPEELAAADPPYWPAEQRSAYRERQAARRASDGGVDPREGYETLFVRKNGERFPVMVYEAPLVDADGRQAGWMSAVLDIGAQRRMEELARQQQDRLQATARLATVGEMASLLSHELNQPLAAIASYATGSLNLLEAPDAETLTMLRQAIERIAEQAERAGRVIKSVHSFVRRRERQREVIAADALIEAVLPLVRLQARKSGTRIELDIPARAPRVLCDRTMVEQVLLNLSRNGIQAMEGGTPLPERELTLRVHADDARRVRFEVVDAGPGIAPDVAERLFTPFFTTRSEGMGLGLSLCRTVIEQHGGALDFGPGPGARGTAFRFSLPAAARVAESGERIAEPS